MQLVSFKKTTNDVIVLLMSACVPASHAVLTTRYLINCLMDFHTIYDE